MKKILNLKGIMKKSGCEFGRRTVNQGACAFLYHEVAIPQELLKLKKEITKKTV